MSIDYEDLFHKGFDEYRLFVNSMIAQRARLAREPIRFVKVEDGTPIDSEGRAIEDMHGLASLGQRHPAITAALEEFLRSDRPSWFPSRVNPYAGRLARTLAERTGYETAFFPCTGTEAVEAALKLARAATGRPRFVSLVGAYHGCTFGSCALMTPGIFRDGFAPHLPGVVHIASGDAEALTRELAQGDVAAVVVEPVQGEGGIRPLPQPFIDALCSATAAHGTLLVADEVQTGLGRTGALLATADWPRRPDVVLLGKALGGGLVPISAMLTRRAIFEGAYGRDFAIGEAHNTTFQGNALGAVAALTMLDLLDEELFARVRANGALLRERLEVGLRGKPLFVEVRSAGLMIGVELAPFSHPWLSFEHFGFPELSTKPLTAALVCHRLYERGYFVFPCGHDWSTVRIQPRLDVAPEKLIAFADAFVEELQALAELD